ncbi:glycosyltransferase family 2 protein [Arthrobacter sp. zg-ZUI100]|uniref:glycosyltransferase family 2 protein n=1 Tax=Arthrobacter jiangjiafuii TaxID=2817475 RepID=UPI001AEEE0C4|nr:glycosyltransferase family 2 protein [Arthrobacter jiangjiafuii]MBP3034797.1 glycosyltransferase family 2 protein [Arthrobacter jiangjiafuii]
MTFEETMPDLSVVIPVHNSGPVLAPAIQQWRRYLQEGRTQIIIVENGSSDESYQTALENAVDTPYVSFEVMQSPKGMGNALRCGIAASKGRRVLLTADDLPFGFSDLEGAAALDEEPLLIIGSKAHPQSQAGRGLMRSLSTGGFKAARRLILGSRVGDSQGTMNVDGEWIRQMHQKFDDPGFLFSTQLVLAAETQKQTIAEVPVTLTVVQGDKETSVTLKDVLKMGLGLGRLRKQKREFSLAPQTGSVKK